MKALISTMALAVALALTLAWPSVGEAQSQKSKARGKTTAKHYVQRPAKVAKRSGGHAPCTRQVWYGCAGWDPDPNVREMIARDVGDDN